MRYTWLCMKSVRINTTASRWRNAHRCLRGIHRSCHLLAETRSFLEDRGRIEDLRQTTEAHFQVRSCPGEPGTQQCDTKFHLRGRGTSAVLGDCSRVLKTQCAQSYDLEG